MNAEEKVKRLFEKMLNNKGQMCDMFTYTKIVASLTREEMSALYRYHEIIRFISAIQVYDDILCILVKDKTKFGKETFEKILAIRNKIAREHRNQIKKNEELFRLNRKGVTKK